MTESVIQPLSTPELYLEELLRLYSDAKADRQLALAFDVLKEIAEYNGWAH